MRTLNNLPADESENGKYIIVKIPRDSVQNLEAFTLDSTRGIVNFRKEVWIVLCIISLFIGGVVGSLFHPDLSHHAPDKTVWKSSNLMVPDGK